MRKIILIAAAMSALLAQTAFAMNLGWQNELGGWKYCTNYDGSEYYSNEWQWIDGNQDGVAECYCFDKSGYMYSNTVTPDGYTVNDNGAWTVNGTVQTKNVSGEFGNSYISVGSQVN